MRHAQQAPADELLKDLREADPQLEGLGAIVLFGSVARGDESSQSDLDLLVVARSSTAALRFRNHLRTVSRKSRPQITSLEALLVEAKRRPSFVCHLLDEGIVAWGNDYWESSKPGLLALAGDRSALRAEAVSRANALTHLESAPRFSNSPITALAHVYGISRGVVIARLLESGIHEYRWQAAFDRLGSVRPDLRNDLDLLRSLRVFYEVARRGRPSSSTSGRECGISLSRAVEAARNIAA